MREKVRNNPNMLVNTSIQHIHQANIKIKSDEKMLEVNAVSKGGQEILSRGSVEQCSPTPRWSTWPCKYCSPYYSHAVVRVSTSGRPSSQRMRNGGLQHRIH